MKRKNSYKALFLLPAAAGVATVLLSRARRFEVKDKVVLITGGSRGLGLALAMEFARQGAMLALCARDEQELKAAKAALGKTQVRVMTMVCDVADRVQVQQFIDATIAEYGRIDVVINNAGIIQVGPVEVMTLEDFEQAMDVMFWGTVYTTFAALPHMREQARIVNIVSIGGKVSGPHLVPHSCAKFAAMAFSEGMRAELRKRGIKVISIAPGLMRTGSYVNAVFKGDSEREATWFSLSSSLPGMTISAERAAKQILASVRSGRAERILTTQANLLARFHGMFPGLTTDLLGLAN